MQTMAEGTLRVGNVELLPVIDAEGPFPVKLGQLFPGVSAEQWEPYQRRYPTGYADAETWFVHFGGCLVRAGGRTLLVDTGIGPEPDAGLFPNMPPRLLRSLAAVGVKPEDIDTVTRVARPRR